MHASHLRTIPLALLPSAAPVPPVNTVTICINVWGDFLKLCTPCTSVGDEKNAELITCFCTGPAPLPMALSTCWCGTPGSLARPAQNIQPELYQLNRPSCSLSFGCHVGRLLLPQISKVPNENVNEASKNPHLTPGSRCRQGERALGRWLVPSDTGACCLLCTNRTRPALLSLCPHPNNLAGVTQEFTEDYPSVPPKASFPGAASALRPALCALPTTFPLTPNIVRTQPTSSTPTFSRRGRSVWCAPRCRSRAP